jgi:hypothetical protein
MMLAEGEPKPHRRRTEATCGAPVAHFGVWVGPFQLCMIRYAYSTDFASRNWVILRALCHSILTSVSDSFALHFSASSGLFHALLYWIKSFHDSSVCEGCSQETVSYPGKFIRSSRSSNLGSERRGSHNEGILSKNMPKCLS